MARFWLRYGWFILLALAGYQFYLAYNTDDWLWVVIHLFAGLVAFAVGVWIIKLRWFSKKGGKHG